MMSKQEIRRLIRADLSGQEAGRLVILDSVEVDHGRPALLTAKDLERIKRSLLPEEASVYNAWIYAYQILAYSLKEAEIRYLEAVSALQWMSTDVPLLLLEELLETLGDYREKIRDDLADRIDAFLQASRMPGEGSFQDTSLRKSQEARRAMRDLLAYEHVLKEMESLLPDADLTEDFGPWRQDIQRRIELSKRERLFYQSKDQPPIISLASLSPSPDIVKHMRERLAMAFGPDWWRQEAGHGR